MPMIMLLSLFLLLVGGMVILAYDFLWQALVITVALEASLMLMGHVFACRQTSYVRGRYRRRFMIDLSWRLPQTYVFLLITVLPFGLPVYLVSLVRFRRARYRGEFIQVEVPRDRDRYDDPAGYRGNTELNLGRRRVQSRSKFVPALNAARAQYITLRGGAWQKRRMARAAELEIQIGQYEKKLKELGKLVSRKRGEPRFAREIVVGATKEVTTVQAGLNSARAELAKIRPAGADDKKIDMTELEAEFTRLMALPGVKAARVINDEISLLVEARCQYAGRWYDLGDWDVRFGDVGLELSATEVRSGLKNPETTSYPAYRHEVGVFCFGNSYAAINQNIARGQFLQAVELAVLCLASVNGEHEHLITERFHRARGVRR